MTWLLLFALGLLIWTTYLIRKAIIKVPNERSLWSDIIIIDSDETLETYLKITNTNSIEELADHYKRFNIFIIDRRCK